MVKTPPSQGNGHNTDGPTVQNVAKHNAEQEREDAQGKHRRVCLRKSVTKSAMLTTQSCSLTLTLPLTPTKLLTSW